MGPIPTPLAGVILAGGQSSRMGGDCKALAPLGSQPMLARVVGRLRPQVDPLLLSVESARAEFRDFGLEQVVDRTPGHRGPLTGLYSALERLAGTEEPDWLLLCPCDAPFLPRNLGERLLRGARDAGASAACALYAGHRQPTFSVWNKVLLDDIERRCLVEGHGGLMQTLDELRHAVVEWPEARVNPFFNVNTPADLARAVRWLDRGPPEA